MDYTKIKKYVERVEAIAHHEEKQVLAVQGLIELFDANIASIYYYSSLSKKVEGIFKISEKGRFSIQEEKEDVRNIPPIYTSIRERKTKYITGSLIHQIPRKYLTELKPFLVTPIFNHSNVIGYVAMRKSNAEDPIHDNLLNALTIYGKLLGKAFEEDNTTNTNCLNHREIEILHRLSWGESNKVIADYMGLSPFTVQDYIKSAMKKLGVQSRVEGVATALRREIIK